MGGGATILILILANVIFSYQGLKNHGFFDAYHFEVNRVLMNKEFKRLFTSGFLHVSWTHLIFNMITLYLFSNAVLVYLGDLKFLLIYFGSLLGGSLLCLFIHRNHRDYSAVGASGAISGIIFASIALFPGLGIGFFLLPVFIPAWLYGLLYILFTIYGIRSKRDNVGHEAHLGGAITGMLLAILIEPSCLVENYTTILLAGLPAIIFLIIIIRMPHILLVDNLFFKKHDRFHSIEHRYNADKVQQQNEVDRILEKIHQKGIKSLSKKEKDALDRYSKKR